MTKNIIDEFVIVGERVRGMILSNKSEIEIKTYIHGLQLRINNSDIELFINDIVKMYVKNDLEIPKQLIKVLRNSREVTFKTYANAYIMGLLGGYQRSEDTSRKRISKI